MKEKIVPILIVLGLSLFCGFIGLFGLGTLTSPLNRVAGPMVCGDRRLEIKQDSSAHKLQILTGVVLSLVLFALAMVFLNWTARRLNVPFEELFLPSMRGMK